MLTKPYIIEIQKKKTAIVIMKAERNIAICDDDKDILQLFTKTCRIYFEDKFISTNIDNFSTGEQLLRENKKYDYILLDIEMDNRNGIEVAEEIRKSDVDTMIVIISGYPKYKNRAYSVHVFDYLDKPVNAGKIMQLLNELERYRMKKINKKICCF